METFVVSSKTKSLQFNSTIAGATEAAPILITTTAAHGLETGDIVFVNGVAGNTAANGTFTVTVSSATSFLLNHSSGNGAYSSGGTVQHEGFQSMPVLVDNTVFPDPSACARIRFDLIALSASTSIRAHVSDAADAGFLTQQPGPFFSMAGPVNDAGVSVMSMWPDARIGGPNNYVRASVYLNGNPGASAKFSVVVNN